MKIIIEHKTSKREIDGAFNICGSRADLLSLYNALQLEIFNAGFSYGWIKVPLETQPSIPNTPPLDWDS